MPRESHAKSVMMSSAMHCPVFYSLNVVLVFGIALTQHRGEAANPQGFLSNHGSPEFLIKERSVSVGEGLDQIGLIILWSFFVKNK